MKTLFAIVVLMSYLWTPYIALSCNFSRRESDASSISVDEKENVCEQVEGLGIAIEDCLNFDFRVILNTDCEKGFLFKGTDAQSAHYECKAYTAESFCHSPEVPKAKCQTIDYNKAQENFMSHNILGSPEKTIVLPESGIYCDSQYVTVNLKQILGITGESRFISKDVLIGYRLNENTGEIQGLAGTAALTRLTVIEGSESHDYKVLIRSRTCPF